MVETLPQPLIKQGWLRAAIFFMVYLLVVGGASLLLQKIFPGSDAVQKNADQVAARQRVLLMVVLTITGCSLAIIWLFRKFVDKKTFFSLGFAPNTQYGSTGALAAIAMLGIGTLLLMAAGHLSFTAPDGGIAYLTLNLLLMLLVALMEEVVFRGYLLNNLMQSMNKWPALGISAVLFTFIHTGNKGAGVLPLVEIFIGGIMLGINYIFTRNLWFGMALHFVWNFVQGPVLGYEVSGNNLPSLFKQEMNGPAWLTGGAFGFEGSALAMVLNVALIALLVAVYQRQLKEAISG